LIKSVNNYPVSQLFDIDSNVIYAVPRYQREYTWGKNQWENLFDDVIENGDGYFLGSIICINQSTDALLLQRLELVDGQQRLATLSLLFTAIYDALKNHESDLDDDQRSELVNLKRKIVLKKGDDQLRFIPQIQNNNHDDYRSILAKTGIIKKFDTPLYAGNRQIYRTFYYFQSRINGMINGQDDRLGAIMKFLDKVNHVSIVKIEVASHADAYVLFESLNNRGIPLSAIDLIKNKLLAKLEFFEPGKVDYYFGEWNKLLGYLGDDYSTQERFFRQYYNAFREELKDIHQVPMATRTNLIEIYESLINRDAKDCLQKISDAGQLYSTILLRNQEESLNGLEKPLRNLERIQGAPAYLLVLFLLIRREKLNLNNDHLSEIVSLLVRFFVRRNLTDVPPTRDLNRLFMTIIESMEGLSGEGIPKFIRERLIEISATDEAFRTKLEGAIYEDNSSATRFILCALEEESMTKETWIDLWRLENKRYFWTIEHIFPQGENIPKCWVDMIAEGDEQKAKAVQQTHVHKLGNLTISGFNSGLGNKSFIEKRDRTDRQGRPEGYKNGLKLNRGLANTEAWSVQQIDARTTDLVEKVVKLFEL
jgi:uncharacterized protein with ParB-like and HNH nuclease domain